VSAGGTVTFNGGPLAGATVSFLPEKGPIAFGTTGQDGSFKLSSGITQGCAVGPAKVAVRMIIPDEKSTSTGSLDPTSAKTPEQLKEISSQMANMTMEHQKKEKSKSKVALIPDRYKDADKSNLKFTVESDASKNNFKIELKD